MRLEWGSYVHGEDTVDLAVWERRPVLSSVNRRLYQKIRVSFRGYLKVSSADPADITTAINNLEAAYASDGQNLVWYDNDNNPTAHSITSSSTVNGTRVVEAPVFTSGWERVWGGGLEYYNRRTFKVTIEAEVDDIEGSGIVAWREKFRLLQAGGPDFVIQEAINGYPQKQYTKQATKMVAEQIGSAIGYSSHPSFPSYMLSASDLKPSPFLAEMGDAMMKGTNSNRYYPIRWHYRFEAVTGITVTAPNEPSL